MPQIENAKAFKTYLQMPQTRNAKALKTYLQEYQKLVVFARQFTSN